jgi:hypothetical protein
MYPEADGNVFSFQYPGMNFVRLTTTSLILPHLLHLVPEKPSSSLCDSATTLHPRLLFPSRK